MLAPLPSESWLADAGVVIDAINALSVVGARAECAVVNVDVAHVSHPAGVADTLVTEEFVHAVPVDAVRLLAQVHLLLATLARETPGAVAGKVVDQVGTGSAEQTRTLSTVVNVDLTVDTLPARWASTVVTAL